MDSFNTTAQNLALDNMHTDLQSTLGVMMTIIVGPVDDSAVSTLIVNIGVAITSSTIAILGNGIEYGGSGW